MQLATESGKPIKIFDESLSSVERAVCARGNVDLCLEDIVEEMRRSDDSRQHSDHCGESYSTQWSIEECEESEGR
jgi:hypothetical protein